MLSGLFLLIFGTISYYCCNINLLFLFFFISIIYVFFLYNNYYDNILISEWLTSDKIEEVEVIGDRSLDTLSLTLCNYTLTILSLVMIGLASFSLIRNGNRHVFFSYK